MLNKGSCGSTGALLRVEVASLRTLRVTKQIEASPATVLSNPANWK